MTPNFSNVLRIPEDLDLIPQISYGLYCLVIRFPSDSELGLNQVKDEVIKDNISCAFQIMKKWSCLHSYTGKVTNQARGTHLAQKFDLSFSRDDIDNSWYLNELMADNGSTTLREVTAYLRCFCSFLPPLYVGKAADQPIHTRIEQHIQIDSLVSKRLAQNDISWRFIGCRYLQVPINHMSEINNLEKIAQSAFKPPLCIM